MARGRGKATEADQVAEVKISDTTAKTVVLWKATRPLTVQEHEDLSAKIRSEEERTGLTILLVPFSVDAEIQRDGEID